MPRLREFKWDSWAEQIRDTAYLDKPTLIAVDTETTGVEFYDEPFAATVTWRRPDGSLFSGYFSLEGDGRKERLLLLRQTLWGGAAPMRQLTPEPAWVFHNAKFDLQKLHLVGVLTDADIETMEIHDTQTIYHLLDENGRKGLKHLAVTVLGYDDTVDVPYASGPKKGQTRKVSREKYLLDKARRELKLTKDDGYHLLPREIVVPYAMRDTEFTLRLYETLMPKLEGKNDPALLDLYRSAMQLKRVLLRMEREGFGLDLPYLEATVSAYGVLVMRDWQRVVELTGKPDLNPASPAQLQAAFAARGVHLESTDKEALSGLDDELAKAVLSYRENQKLHKTYLLGLQRAQRDGIVHPSFNDDGAKTGRMSSGKAVG